MNILIRTIALLCTIALAGLSLPALAQAQTLRAADSKICCETPDGKFTTLSSRRCRAAHGWPVPARLCRPNDTTVCCKTRVGYKAIPKKQCNHPTHARNCKQPPKRVCCEKSDGSASYMMSNRCWASGGWPGPEVLCKQPDKSVCCKTHNGHKIVPSSKCRRPYGRPVDARHCKADVYGVCCKTRHGYSWAANTRCRKPFGTIVSPEYCRRVQAGKICCKYPVAGAPALFGFMTLKKCKNLNGNKVANHYCLQPRPGLTLRNSG